MFDTVCCRPPSLYWSTILLYHRIQQRSTTRDKRKTNYLHSIQINMATSDNGTASTLSTLVGVMNSAYVSSASTCGRLRPFRLFVFCRREVFGTQCRTNSQEGKHILALFSFVINDVTTTTSSSTLSTYLCHSTNTIMLSFLSPSLAVFFWVPGLDAFVSSSSASPSNVLMTNTGRKSGIRRVLTRQ